MTVKELREHLELFDDNALVLVTSDEHHTEVSENVSIGQVVYRRRKGPAAREGYVVPPEEYDEGNPDVLVAVLLESWT